MLNLMLALLATLASATSPAPIDIETTIQPVTHDEYQLLTRAAPGMYRCAVFVHDETNDRRVWGTNDILIAPGGSAEKTVVAGALRLDAKASLTKEKDRAEVRVTIFRDGVVVHRQTSRVVLR